MVSGVELSDIKWAAVGLAVLSNIVIGFLWYSNKTPTGKVWLRGIGMDPNMKPGAKQMTIAMILMVVGAVLLMFVFMHTFVAYRDAYSLDERPLAHDMSMMEGLMGGFFTWLGFFVPILWGVVAWENKPWSLFFVNAGYYLVTLLIASVIYASFI